jgi:hypothetical protein
MRVTFSDLEEEDDNPLNGSQLSTGEEVLKLLESLKVREPFICEFVAENGYQLTMGIGGAWAYAEFSRSDGEPPYFEAVSPSRPKEIPGSYGRHYQAAIQADRQSGTVSPEFMCGGTPTPIPTRYILPYARAREIAIYFVETGQRDPDIHWEAI